MMKTFYGITPRRYVVKRSIQLRHIHEVKRNMEFRQAGWTRLVIFSREVRNNCKSKDLTPFPPLTLIPASRAVPERLEKHIAG
jgi:hypothetical protein